jgi:hypothetical protein
LVINLDVKDSHEEAANAAPHALKLCTMVGLATILPTLLHIYGSLSSK